MVGIVDYGLGNVRAFANVFDSIGVSYRFCRTEADLNGVTRVLLPGVGSFDWAIERLSNSGMRERLEERVLGDGLPLLGVCVGMQMLAEQSEEGNERGLGWIGGEVVKMRSSCGESITLPHMGWNDVNGSNECPLFRNLTAPRFYFLHSYEFVPRERSSCVGEASYSKRFTVAVQRGRIFGVQFHPEKSHSWGTKLLENFATIC